MDETLAKAIAVAAARYPGGQWLSLSPSERVTAIYDELRRLDLERVLGLPPKQNTDPPN